MRIETEHLRLVLQTREEVLAMVKAMRPADRAEVSPDWLARIYRARVPDPWTFTFSLVHQVSGTTIGACGFKGPPGDDGIVGATKLSTSESVPGSKPFASGRGGIT